MRQTLSFQPCDLLEREQKGHQKSLNGCKDGKSLVSCPTWGPGSLRLRSFFGGETANLSPSCEQQHTPHEESHFSSLDPFFYIASSRGGRGYPRWSVASGTLRQKKAVDSRTRESEPVKPQVAS